MLRTKICPSLVLCNCSIGYMFKYFIVILNQMQIYIHKRSIDALRSYFTYQRFCEKISFNGQLISPAHSITMQKSQALTLKRCIIDTSDSFEMDQLYLHFKQHLVSNEAVLSCSRKSQRNKNEFKLLFAVSSVLRWIQRNFEQRRIFLATSGVSFENWKTKVKTYSISVKRLKRKK